MSNPEQYDLVILGSGEAGKYLAWTLASEGKRVAVVERRYVGGPGRTSPACRGRT
jgi:pyruvate/2-oxoglutarate dehydrogenase complex dihydrolipoamide dehydrogenase (E3) component